MITSQCLFVTTDFFAPAANDPTANGNGTLVAAGSWLDPGDPRVGAAPPGAVQDQCPPPPIVSVLYFCSYNVIVTAILLQVGLGVLPPKRALPLPGQLTALSDCLLQVGLLPRQQPASNPLDICLNPQFNRLGLMQPPTVNHACSVASILIGPLP